jgi:hypothetical protein
MDNVAGRGAPPWATGFINVASTFNPISMATGIAMAVGVSTLRQTPNPRLFRRSNPIPRSWAGCRAYHRHRTS